MTGPRASEAGPPAIDVPQRLQASRLGMLVPRALAYAIDNFAFLAAVFAVDSATGPGRPRNDALALLSIAAWFAYFVACERLWGQTLGKLAIGIKVVDRQGGPITLGQSLGRNLLRPFEVGPKWFLLPGVVSVLLTRSSQRLGDLAARTYVVPTSLLRPARPRVAGQSAPDRQG